MRIASRYLLGQQEAADREVIDGLSASAEALADPVERARVTAALQHALGRGWRVGASSVPAVWRAPV
ncbi:MAG TPA: hypothetical protein VND21_03150, partial [Planctomycetota bacterium]|nr:hypothetical protein [Planctomycetota bacterium]